MFGTSTRCLSSTLSINDNLQLCWGKDWLIKPAAQCAAVNLWVLVSFFCTGILLVHVDEDLQLRFFAVNSELHLWLLFTRYATQKHKVDVLPPLHVDCAWRPSLFFFPSACQPSQQLHASIKGWKLASYAQCLPCMLPKCECKVLPTFGDPQWWELL